MTTNTNTQYIRLYEGLITMSNLEENWHLTPKVYANCLIYTLGDITDYKRAAASIEILVDSDPNKSTVDLSIYFPGTSIPAKFQFQGESNIEQAKVQGLYAYSILKNLKRKDDLNYD